MESLLDITLQNLEIIVEVLWLLGLNKTTECYSGQDEGLF